MLNFQVEQEVVGEVGQLPLMLRAMVAIGSPRAHHHAPRLGNKMCVARLLPPHPDIAPPGQYIDNTENFF